MPPAQMNVHSFGSARKIQTITECPPLLFFQKGRWTFWTTCNFNHFFLTHCKYEKHEHYCTKSTFYTLLCLFTWETFSAHDTNSSIQIQYWNQRWDYTDLPNLYFLSWVKNWIEQNDGMVTWYNIRNKVHVVLDLTDWAILTNNLRHNKEICM